MKGSIARFLIRRHGNRANRWAFMAILRCKTGTKPPYDVPRDQCSMKLKVRGLFDLIEFSCNLFRRGWSVYCCSVGKYSNKPPDSELTNALHLCHLLQKKPQLPQAFNWVGCIVFSGFFRGVRGDVVSFLFENYPFLLHGTIKQMLAFVFYSEKKNDCTL
jgi:hypothetical protein